MSSPFLNFDLSDFWETNEYALNEYVSEPLTAEEIDICENQLGYKFPLAYIELLQSQNGGLPTNTCFPVKTRTSYAEDHIAINGIFGIGREKHYSIGGRFGSKFWIEEWTYPDIGIYICDCPSAGHDMICLDYRKNGRDGEPEVVHVDQEMNYNITFLASNVEEFIRGLVNTEVYDTSERDLKAALSVIENGRFSSILTELLSQAECTEFGGILRNLCSKLALEKGHFSLHADPLSYLVYDLQFYLYANSRKVKNQKHYLKFYPQMIAISDGEFSTNGYAPSFIEDWLSERITSGAILRSFLGELRLSPSFVTELFEKLQPYSKK